MLGQSLHNLEHQALFDQAAGIWSRIHDFSLIPQRGDMEIDLANTAFPAEPGQAAAYLTATSCATLFDGPYPGSLPLCKVLVGPAAPRRVSARVPLDAGTYRLWVHGYTSNTSAPHVLIDIDLWDTSCRTPLQF